MGSAGSKGKCEAYSNHQGKLSRSDPVDPSASPNMPKKRNRYSTSLAADWAFPVPLAQEEPSPKESLFDEDEARRPDHAYNAPPASTLAPTDSMKKPSRYKKVLPSSWVELHSSPSTVDEPAPTQIFDGQVQPNMNSIHYGYLETENDGRRIGRPQRLDVVATIPTTGDSQYTPPPAPTHQRVLFPFQEADGSYGTPANVLPNTTDRRTKAPSLRENSERRLFRDRSMERSFQFRDHQAAHFPVSPQDTHAHYFAISPPVSVGQQSSESTTSPFHGRDLPAKGPSVSPTYSVL